MLGAAGEDFKGSYGPDGLKNVQKALETNPKRVQKATPGTQTHTYAHICTYTHTHIHIQAQTHIHTGRSENGQGTVAGRPQAIG